MRIHRTLLAAVLATTLLHLPARAAALSGEQPRTSSRGIPWTDVGPVAGANYSGNGLTVTATEGGAQLRCVFQRIDAQATREGLWLTSTVTDRANDRFRVTAAAVAGKALPKEGEVSV